MSIVIPCLNEAENIGKCIDALRRQTYDGKFEIIVVDNGSTDGSLKIAQGRGINLLCTGEKGPAAAKNKGIKNAKGDIIIFIDADCIADSNWLKNIIAPFDDMEVGCVAGEIIAFEPQTLIEQFLTDKRHLSQSVNVNHKFLPYAATANAAYRKKLFENVGFFDEKLRIGEDADMSWRMQLQSRYRLKYVPEAVVYHPHEVSLGDLFKQKKRHACGAVALYKKYKKLWPEQRKPIKKIYWEYHSITKRLLRFSKNYFINRGKNLDESHMQTVFEAGWMFGLLVGAIKYRVWYR